MLEPELLKGKTLEDALNMIKDDTMLFIGSASAYFFVGTADEAKAGIDDISQMFLTAYTVNYETTKKKLAELPKEATWDGKQDLSIYADRLLKIAEDIKTIRVANRRAMKCYESFKPMLKRTVRDAYPKLSPDTGMAIILTGLEQGEYWMKSEWDAAHGIKKGAKNGNKKNR